MKNITICTILLASFLFNTGFHSWWWPFHSGHGIILDTGEAERQEAKAEAARAEAARANALAAQYAADASKESAKLEAEAREYAARQDSIARESEAKAQQYIAEQESKKWSELVDGFQTLVFAVPFILALIAMYYLVKRGMDNQKEMAVATMENQNHLMLNTMEAFRQFLTTSPWNPSSPTAPPSTPASMLEENQRGILSMDAQAPAQAQPTQGYQYKAPVQQRQSYQPRPTQAEIRAEIRAEVQAEIQAQPVFQEQPNIIVNVVIPETVRRGMIARGGDDAYQNDDGNWIVTQNGNPIARMKPKVLTGPTS